MHHTSHALIVCGLALAACEQRRPSVPTVPFAPAPAAEKLLLAYFPELDHRIVEIDPQTGEQRRVWYPDQWYSDLRLVRDFAADQQALWLLLGSRQDPEDQRLFRFDLASKAVTSTSLDPAPVSLTWRSPRQLLVGHGTTSSGPPGLLSLFDTVAQKVLGTVALEGACVSVALGGRSSSTLDRAYVVERRLLQRGEEVVGTSALAEIDLDKGRVVRRVALPPGTRQVLVGPTGLLYVAHVSGHGALETDGTVSVLHPEDLTVVDRLRQSMVVRRMTTSGQHLMLNMLSSTGEAWLSVIDRGHRTVVDTRVHTLVGAELLFVAGRAWTPLRRGKVLAWIDPLTLRAGELKLKLKSKVKVEDRPQLLRGRLRGGRAR